MNTTQSKSTLVAVGVATIWILILHGIIVFWAMSEPASIERRVDYGQRTAPQSKAVPRPETSSERRSTNDAEALQSPTTEIAKSMAPVNPTLGWSHVAFPAVLLGSCVAIFAVLIWAAVTLNREFD